jgi:hypothetical protein
MKKNTPRLTLNKETLRVLESIEAREANGGMAEAPEANGGSLTITIVMSCVSCNSCRCETA